MMDIITEKIKNTDEYLPDTNKYRIKLDANESPFVPSDDILCKFIQKINTAEFNRYPDPYATELVQKYAKIYKISSRNIVAGNGSDELISLICSGFIESGDNITVTVPDFSMYEFYSNFVGANVTHYKKDESFGINFDNLLKQANENRSKIIIFSNPCNPTGNLFKRNEIINLIKNANSLVIVDEAYMDFAEDNQSLIDLVNEFENLIVLKTLSKAFASAALRIGFAMANENIIKAIKKFKSPYNLNSISQLFGSIVLENYFEVENNLANIKNNTRYLFEQLSDIETSSIVKVFPTSANFVYIKLLSSDEALRITGYLKKNSIAIRCMEKSGCIRISAGKKDEIDELLLRIKEVVL